MDPDLAQIVRELIRIVTGRTPPMGEELSATLALLRHHEPTLPEEITLLWKQVG